MPKSPHLDNLTEKQIQRIVIQDILDKGNVACPNMKWIPKFESDIIALSKSGLISEFEIKRSKSDFKADFKKKRKRGRYTKHELLALGRMPVNYFYFVSEPDVIELQDVPAHAGLVHIINHELHMIKKAPRLHQQKADRSTLLNRMARSLAFKWIK